MARRVVRSNKISPGPIRKRRAVHHLKPPSNPQLERLFPGDSEMARRMRELDWSATDFGPPANWPENLRVAVSICLPCRFPIVIWWGERFCLLYNDAYLPWLTAKKHPRVLGRPGIECWPELWDLIGPMLESVLATGKATWSEDAELYLQPEASARRSLHHLDLCPHFCSGWADGGRNLLPVYRDH